jgi:hypothetical protein
MSLFFFFCFSYTKSENRRVEQVLPGRGGLVPLGRGRREQKDEGVGIWCKYCVHMYINGKMVSVETITRMRGVNKGEWWKG